MLYARGHPGACLIFQCNLGGRTEALWTLA